MQISGVKRFTPFYFYGAIMLTVDEFLKNPDAYYVTTTGGGAGGVGFGSSSIEPTHIRLEDEIQKLKKSLEQINERLAILEPKPELLEKYEMLRKAYEDYKILEAMLTSP